MASGELLLLLSLTGALDGHVRAGVSYNKGTREQL